jgi:hypothetical protein
MWDSATAASHSIILVSFPQIPIEQWMYAASAELASRRHRMMAGTGTVKELAADAAMEIIPDAVNESTSHHGNSPRCHGGRGRGGGRHRRQELGGPRE